MVGLKKKETTAINWQEGDIGVIMILDDLVNRGGVRVCVRPAEAEHFNCLQPAGASN